MSVYKKYYKKILAAGLILIFLGLLVFYILKLLEPASPIYSLVFSNITDSQLSVSYVTAKPVKTTVIVSANNKFPILPVFTRVFRDDREKGQLKQGFYSSHKVTVSSLNPKTKYKFRIYEGWKKIYEGSFQTAAVLSSITAPNPVYGRVLEKDKKTPATGVLVYLYTAKDASRSAVLSTLTNKEGRWSLDLANLRSKDLRSGFKVSSSSAEEIIVEGGIKGRVRAETKPGHDKPWPDVILK